MKEWESRLRSCVRTRVQLFGQDIKLVRVTLVSAGTQSSGRLLENKWKNTITSPKTEVLASNKGGPITTTMAARVQNDSTNRSLNTRANWIKKQVEERKLSLQVSPWGSNSTTPPDSKGEKEEGWRTNTTLIRGVFWKVSAHLRLKFGQEANCCITGYWEQAAGLINLK